MKFLFNSTLDPNKSMATQICIYELSNLLHKKGYTVGLNDWKNYDLYDVVIFMPYDAKISEARKANPSILVGIADPKLSNEKQKIVAREADFLMVSSIEQRDKFLEYNSNVFIYYMFPNIIIEKKEHVKKKKLVLGYHGNKVHLHCASPHLMDALDKLSEKYNLEFWVIYNIELLGKWEYGLPKNIKVRHIQWSENIYDTIFKDVDIGIVPNLIPNNFKNNLSFVNRLFMNDKEDYFIRYKYSSNPGRQYIFAMKHIPMVSEMYPSSSQFLFHGTSGELVSSAYGWYNSIEKLIKFENIRNEYAGKAYESFMQYGNKDIVIEQLLDFINKIDLESKKVVFNHKKNNYKSLFFLFKDYMHRLKRKLGI